MSAQEAAYHVLSLSLSKKSRKAVFINTSPINERVLMSKSENTLKSSNKESTEINMADIFEKYSKRNRNLDEIFLADYAANYNNTKNEEGSNSDTKISGVDKKRQIITANQAMFSIIPDEIIDEELEELNKDNCDKEDDVGENNDGYELSNDQRIDIFQQAGDEKTAFLINGVTLHSAFASPCNLYVVNIPELSSDLANNIRKQLCQVQLVIIDEISMVGSTVLGYVNTRLRQITGVNEPFGSISVLAVGDLNQLPPVKN
ncbi:ATP-dependent DNA helicase pfh1-like [Chelonus insularis]|uniref:ATP-dependent DNA helicase pfh1-like n=1 Tax=Chelonus insularis TaxID=460826 RepID=UPI00158B9E01|nr:ATP-dependent DNA helicase pfh1-like [Chelonus insularis]